MPLPNIDAGSAAAFGDDPWTLTADSAALNLPRTPAVLTVGNGFIGVRGPGEAPGAPRVYLNGVFAATPITYHEAAHGYPRSSDTRVAVADATQLAVTADGVAAVVDTAVLDMATGTLRETRRAGPVTVVVETLCAMDRSGVVAMRVRVHADAAAEVILRRSVGAPPSGGSATGAIYDPRVAAPTGAAWVPEPAVLPTGATGRVDRLASSGYAVAALATALDVRVALAAGDMRTFDGVAVYAASPRGDPLATAAATFKAAVAAGHDALAAEQSGWFGRFWADAGVRLADPAAAQALHHALFQLVQAAGRDGHTSLAAKGQTGEGYEGHVFWDAEIYALPVFVYLAPATARAMLKWRIDRLDAARANARVMGHARGALYPWRTIAGAECSSFFPAGAAQYHINSDIAHALRLYVATTGDRSILAEGGAAMLAETARIWLDTGFHDPVRGGFVINRVTGPDEYSALVDNNYYTNLMAAEHLRFAADAGDVTAAEAANMRRAADAVVLPHDATRDVPAQDDSFFALEPWPIAATPADRFPLLLHYHPLAIYRRRVAKQADTVLAAALLPEAFDHATRRRMLDVYEAVTVHDSTLSASAFGILAAQVGELARAAAYWRITLLTDIGDLFGNTGHGLHMAALGGGWNVLALGFAGLQTIDGTLRFAPHFAPDVGDYAMQVQFQGRLIRLEVDARQTRYTLVSGAPLILTHFEEVLRLAGDIVRAHRP